MQDLQPSWWYIREASSIAPADYEGGPTVQYHILFEFFRRNANEYAILRLSLSDGCMSMEGTYSHDEIFAGHRLSQHSDDASESMRRAVERGGGDDVQVSRTIGSAVTFNVIIRLGDAAKDVRLELKESITCEVFVDRMMSYVADVRSRAISEQDLLHSRLARRNELQAEVDAAMRHKIQEDRDVENGLKRLMLEKRKYWS